MPAPPVTVVVKLSGDEPLTRTGKVSLGGVLKDISLAYVPEAQVGDYVLVHVGFALSVIDESEAQFVQEYLRQTQASLPILSETGGEAS